HHGLGDDLDRRLQRYARLDAELLHAVGDDRFSIGAATSRRRGPMIVPISEIQIGKRLRQLRESTVTELMESISRIGLRTPITVDSRPAKREGGGMDIVVFDLVAGHHRLEAWR